VYTLRATFVGNPVDDDLARPRTTLLGVTFASGLHSFGMQTSEFRPRGVYSRGAQLQCSVDFLATGQLARRRGDAGKGNLITRHLFERSFTAQFLVLTLPQRGRGPQYYGGMNI